MQYLKHRVATTYTDSLQFDNISYSVYIEYDYFNPVYLTQGWMKYGAAFKNLHKAFSELFFLIEKLRESSRLTELKAN